MPISARMLNDDEEVLVDMRPHWLFFVGPGFWTLVALIAAITLAMIFPKAPHFVGWILTAMVVVPAIWLAARTIRWFGYSLVVTTFRIIIKQGVVRRDLIQLRLQRITEVHFTQRIVQRMLGTGRMMIDAEGESDLVTIDDVRNPRALQRVINNQLNVLNQRWQGPAAADPGRPGPSPAYSQAEAPVAFDADRTPPHGQPHVAPAGPVAEPNPGPSSGSPTRPEPPQPTLHQQLLDLDDLRRRGILTPAEFEAKKADLLSRL
jgi:membrane protein YdbS with pleckstrin-like domain